jgi:hypothetical protein
LTHDKCSFTAWPDLLEGLMARADLVGLARQTIISVETEQNCPFALPANKLVKQFETLFYLEAASS